MGEQVDESMVYSDLDKGLQTEETNIISSWMSQRRFYETMKSFI